MECPTALHKKCMNKKNKIIKNIFIVCYLHHKKDSKKKKDKKKEESGKKSKVKGDKERYVKPLRKRRD